MASNRKPRGSVVRFPPDWFATSLMGANAPNGPCVGNVAGVGIFNNASDGSVIRVYGINYDVTASQILYFKMTKGASGTLYTGTGAAAPIDPRAPLAWGQIYTQATAAGVGTAVGGVTAIANVAYDLAPGYPLAIIPPGYTWSVESQATNQQIIVGFRWLSCYE